MSATGHSSVHGIAPTTDGGAYIAGAFEGTLSLPGAAPLTARGRTDGYVARIDSAGKTRWVSAFGSPSADSVASLAGGGKAGVALAGVIGRGARFAGRVLEVPGHPASFVTRIARDGRVAWTRTIGSTDYAVVRGVALDEGGAVLAVGSFAGTLRFGDTVLTSGGAQDAFVLKFARDGSPVWARRAGGPFPDFAHGVATHRGRVAVVGAFGVRADFGARIIASRGSSLDGFIAVYEPNGTLAWVRRVGGQGRDAAQKVAFDDAGNLYAIGSFMGEGRFGGKGLSSADEADVFLVSLDQLGLHRWSRRLGGKGIDTAGALGVSRDRVLVGGSFAGLGLFGTRELDTKGKHDVFLVTYSLTGTPLASRRYGSRGDESVAAMAALPGGEVLLAGSYTGAPTIGGARFDARGPVAGFTVRLRGI